MGELGSGWIKLTTNSTAALSSSSALDLDTDRESGVKNAVMRQSTPGPYSPCSSRNLHAHITNHGQEYLCVGQGSIEKTPSGLQSHILSYLCILLTVANPLSFLPMATFSISHKTRMCFLVLWAGLPVCRIECCGRSSSAFSKKSSLNLSSIISPNKMKSQYLKAH